MTNQTADLKAQLTVFLKKFKYKIIQLIKHKGMQIKMLTTKQQINNGH